jgi:hypothetical protein
MGGAKKHKVAGGNAGQAIMDLGLVSITSSCQLLLSFPGRGQKTWRDGLEFQGHGWKTSY